MFTINGKAIKNPTGFGIERYTLTKSTRVANGDMVMDFVANKRKFTFNYKQIESPDFDKLVDMLWTELQATKKCFGTLSYTYNGKVETAIVYAGAIPANLHRGDGRIWVWKDVQFSLIER